MDATKAGLPGKFIAAGAYIKQEESSQSGHNTGSPF